VVLVGKVKEQNGAIPALEKVYKVALSKALQRLSQK
jgi:hypothetical protein